MSDLSREEQPLDAEHVLEPVDADEPAPAWPPVPDPVVSDVDGRLWRIRRRGRWSALRSRVRAVLTRGRSAGGEPLEL